MRINVFLVFLIFTGLSAQQSEFSRQDSLRGSDNEFRNWWGVNRYDITVEPDFENKSIKGVNQISFYLYEGVHNSILQLDLQEPMKIDKIVMNGKELKDYSREGNVYFVNLKNELTEGKMVYMMKVYFSGNPRIAVNAPWDGGWIFTKDKKGRPWMTTAVQGLGASAWYPNKDYQGYEPQQGASLTMVVDKDLIGVSNGRLVEKKETGQKMSYKWEVKSPINNYNITPYIGHYSEIKDTYQGENGKLDVDYWVLDYNTEKAKNQFNQSKMLLEALEYWFGPYPFYEDSFKLVEAPHLGMEHQSGVAYGNNFEDGYLGSDLSGSGWGLKWDFIIVHESGHEWFGNNITTKDIADMWVHEGFTSYSETLFTEYHFGKEAGNDYVTGTRKKIQNDKPIIGVYNVHKAGSSDMYYKGANMIHTLRQWINDDELFRNILRGLNFNFKHSTVTTQQVESYIEQKSKLNLKPFFDQYLRTTMIPVFEYELNGNEITYRWNSVVDGFEMPVKLSNTEIWLHPTSKWKTEKLPENTKVLLDRNFYVHRMKVK